MSPGRGRTPAAEAVAVAAHGRQPPQEDVRQDRLPQPYRTGRAAVLRPLPATHRRRHAAWRRRLVPLARSPAPSTTAAGPPDPRNPLTPGPDGKRHAVHRRRHAVTPDQFADLGSRPGAISDSGLHGRSPGGADGAGAALAAHHQAPTAAIASVPGKIPPRLALVGSNMGRGGGAPTERLRGAAGLARTS